MTTLPPKKWHYFISLILDYLISCALGYGMAFIIVIIANISLRIFFPELLLTHQPTLAIASFFLITSTYALTFLTYFTIFLRSTRQATLGMRLFNIHLANKHNQRISRGQVFLRCLLPAIPSIIWFINASTFKALLLLPCLYIIDLLFIFLPKNNRTLSDIITNSYVASGRPSDKTPSTAASPTFIPRKDILPPS